VGYTRTGVLDWRVGPDGVPEDLGMWVQSSPPDLWGMPYVSDFFQVGYVCWGVRPWVNAVILHLSKTQTWDSPLQLRMRTTYRTIVPVEQNFWLGSAKFVVLDPTTVVETPSTFFGDGEPRSLYLLIRRSDGWRR